MKASGFAAGCAESFQGVKKLGICHPERSEGSPQLFLSR
jgi:hypothetical protein